MDGKIGHLKEDFGRLNEDMDRMNKSQQELGDKMGAMHGEIANLVQGAEDEKKLSAARYTRLSDSATRTCTDITTLHDTISNISPMFQKPWKSSQTQFPLP